MAEGAMYLLNVVKVTRVTFETVKEVSDAVEEFESFEGGEADLPGWDVPKKTNKCHSRHKRCTTFLFMPWDAQVLNSPQDLCAVVVVVEVSINKEAVFGRVAENIEIILILEHRKDSFTLPDVESGISDHPRVTAGAGGAERVVMVYEKGIGPSLEDQPGFMGGKDRAGTMELGYV
jgi:hypothetical protein